MTRILLHICYLGGEFYGWQKQGNGLPTVQAALETAAAGIAGHPVEVIAAGRTDRGVHALGMTAHFDTSAERPVHAWIAGVNSRLPAGIAVIAAREVDPDFHARFDAMRRSYRYVLSNSPVRPVLLRGRVGWTFTPLNIEAMRSAARLLLGERDFSSFRSSECQAKTPVKTMFAADVYRDRDLICFDFVASGFLHHMVRNMVGALLEVGRGKIDEDGLRAVIEARSRSLAPPTFPADGLYFTGAIYPERFRIEPPRLPAWFWGKRT